MYGGHMDTTSVWQSMLSLCCICTADIQTSSKHTWGHPNIWKCPHIFRGHPNIGVPKHTGSIQTYGDTNIQEDVQTWGYPNIQGVIQTYFGIQTYGGPSKYMGVSKHMGHPDIGSAQTYRRHSNIGGVKHMGGLDTGGAQTYGGVQTWGHPNIQVGIQKYSGCIQTYGDIQAYKRPSKHTVGASKYLGTSKHTRGIYTCVVFIHRGGVQTYGGIQTYRGHPNIWGYPMKQVLPIVDNYIQLLLLQWHHSDITVVITVLLWLQLQYDLTWLYLTLCANRRHCFSSFPSTFPFNFELKKYKISIAQKVNTASWYFHFQIWHWTEGTGHARRRVSWSALAFLMSIFSHIW